MKSKHQQIYGNPTLYYLEAMESVMCDVIKIHKKRKDEWGCGKGNPHKRYGFKRIFMTSHMSHFSALII